MRICPSHSVNGTDTMNRGTGREQRRQIYSLAIHATQPSPPLDLSPPHSSDRHVQCSSPHRSNIAIRNDTDNSNRFDSSSAPSKKRSSKMRFAIPVSSSAHSHRPRTPTSAQKNYTPVVTRSVCLFEMNRSFCCFVTSCCSNQIRSLANCERKERMQMISIIIADRHSSS